MTFYRFTTTALAMVLSSLLIPTPCQAQPRKVDFAKRQAAIKERFEQNTGKPLNKAVHDPPMIDARDSDLGDDEPVIGVYLNKEARAYPLIMLFGGGGIFELLNDTCGGQPIAASW